MSKAAPLPAPPVASHVKWLILVIASIGFAFDIYELLMLPLILGPSLAEMLNLTPGTPEMTAAVAKWRPILFYVPAFCGGIFGLFGGYLTDRLGRRFVLTWSILLYAFAAFFAGFSTNPWMLLFFRTLCFIGVCVEFVAAVAWLAELFPDPIEREKALGYTQAFSSIGGLMVAIANELSISYSAQLPTIQLPGFLAGLGEIRDPHAAWRYTLMSGLIPAIPLILIRPFLPESPAWAAKKAAGTLKRASIFDLFAPALRRTSIATTIGFACTLGIAFGAIQQMPEVVKGLKGELKVGAEELAKKRLATAEKEAEKKSTELTEKAREGIKKKAAFDYGQKRAAEYTKVQEIGGLVGRFLMAFLLAKVVHWGWSLRYFQIPGMILTPILFYYFLRVDNPQYFEIDLSFMLLGKLPITLMSIGIFFIGLFTVAQLSFWGNYLPHAYPVHLRGTGESMAANIGGRLIGTSAAALTAYLAAFMTSYKDLPLQFATAAAIIGGTIALIGVIASFYLPEPSGEHDHA